MGMLKSSVAGGTQGADFRQPLRGGFYPIYLRHSRGQDGCGAVLLEAGVDVNGDHVTRKTEWSQRSRGMTLFSWRLKMVTLRAGHLTG